MIGGDVVVTKRYRLKKKSTMKIPDETKKNVVLKKSDPRMGYPAGQKGDVQPIEKMIAAIVRRIAANTQRLRSDKFSSIAHFTWKFLYDHFYVFEYFALTVSLILRW